MAGPIPFAIGRTVPYPDFALEYTGQRRVTSAQYLRGFLYYDFRVKRGDRAQEVSWTDGVGLHGPVAFALDGVQYTLEVTDRTSIGPFAAGRLVVGERK